MLHFAWRRTSRYVHKRMARLLDLRPRQLLLGAMLIPWLLTLSPTFLRAQEQGESIAAEPGAAEPNEAAPVEPGLGDQGQEEPVAEALPHQANPEASEHASEEVSAAEARALGLPPKVVVIVVGDPDALVRAQALRLSEAIDASDRLRQIHDRQVRAALRGESSDESEDGLSRIRSMRRQLGLGEVRDAPILQALGERGGAVLVVVLRAGVAGAVRLVALDTAHGAFYEGSISLTPDISAETILRFLLLRARRSVENASTGGSLTPTSIVPQDQANALATSAEALATSAEALATSAEEPATAPEEGWFEQYWPYGAAALLLGGMITAIALTSGSADAGGQPLLRFVPGGG